MRGAAAERVTFIGKDRHSVRGGIIDVLVRRFAAPPVWLTRPTLDRPCASNGHAWIRSGYPYSRHHIDIRKN